MGNIGRLARELLNPTKKMEEVLTVLKKDYNIKPAQKSVSKEEIKMEERHKNEDTESMLNQLPSCIQIPREDSVAEYEDERYYYYLFNLSKYDEDSSKYELSYYCWLYDLELVAFSGSLQEVATKMLSWCKEKGYISQKLP